MGTYRALIHKRYDELHMIDKSVWGKERWMVLWPVRGFDQKTPMISYTIPWDFGFSVKEAKEKWEAHQESRKHHHKEVEFDVAFIYGDLFADKSDEKVIINCQKVPELSMEIEMPAPIQARDIINQYPQGIINIRYICRTVLDRYLETLGVEVNDDPPNYKES